MAAAEVQDAVDLLIIERGACGCSTPEQITWHDASDCDLVQRMEREAAAHRQVLADRANAFNEGEL